MFSCLFELLFVLLLYCWVYLLLLIRVGSICLLCVGLLVALVCLVVNVDFGCLF